MDGRKARGRPRIAWDQGVQKAFQRRGPDWSRREPPGPDSVDGIKLLEAVEEEPNMCVCLSSKWNTKGIKSRATRMIIDKEDRRADDPAS